MALLTIPSIFTGPKKYRIIGIVCCCIALSATAWDGQAGKERRFQIDLLRIELIDKNTNQVKDGEQKY